MGARSDDDPTRRAVRELPSVLPVEDQFGSRIRGELAEFLDCDGTLTPIVDEPDAALLPDVTRATIEKLAAVALVAIVGGKAGIDVLAYAVSHGFDILHPDGVRGQLATAHVGELDPGAELDAEGHLPVYMGDDLTDEDGFRAVEDRDGVAVVVRGEDDRRWIADAALDTLRTPGASSRSCTTSRRRGGEVWRIDGDG